MVKCFETDAMEKSVFSVTGSGNSTKADLMHQVLPTQQNQNNSDETFIGGEVRIHKLQLMISRRVRL